MQLNHKFSYIPFMVYEVNEYKVFQLENIEEVVSIQVDSIRKISLSKSI